ncbi:MAG: PAS domain S-box protein [Caldilineaceae bacterium]
MNIDDIDDIDDLEQNWAKVPKRLFAQVLGYGTRLERKDWILLLDVGWVAMLALMLFSGLQILAFHLLFVVLTVGAFYWSFKAFALRAGVAVSAAMASLVVFVAHGVIPIDELVEIPALFSMLVIVFLIAKLRSLVTQEMWSLNEQLEYRVAEKTASLEAEIEERRQTELVLLESREQYRRLVELAFEAIFIHADGSILHANQPAVELLGADSNGDLIGRSIHDFIHPDSQAMVRQRLQQLSDGANGVPPVEERYVRFDGRSVDVEVATIDIVYHEHPAMLTVVRDITPRKQAEEARLAERTSIARDLHDLLGQNLGYLHLKLDQFAGYDLARPLGDIHRDLVRMRVVADEAYQQIRNMIAATLPANNAPLAEALRTKARTIGERAQFSVNVIEIGQPHTLSSVMQEQVLSMCSEGLTNVAKHSCATAVKIILCWYDRSLSLTMTDNGDGFDLTALQGTPTFGLRIMEERAAQVHGTLTIQSQPGQGTKLSLYVPLPAY